MASVPSLHGKQEKKWKQWEILFSWVPKSLWMVTVARKLKDPWKESYEKPRQCIKRQRHQFANKGLNDQRHSFSSSHVQMWELDHKEGWAPKIWCFCIVVLEKTLENLWDCKIKPANPKGNQPWIFTGRTDADAKVSILWPPDLKSWLNWRRPWCWERLRAGGEAGNRGWDGWISQ